MITPTEARDRIRFLEESAQKKTFFHELNPFAALAVTLFFTLCVISLGKYSLSALLPFALFPLYTAFMGELPANVLLLWLKASLPLLLGLGIVNPFLDKETFLFLGFFSVSAGWISFLTLLIKGLLTVSAALCLVAFTGLPRLSFALRRMGFPKVMVLQLLLMGRYTTLLLEEGSRILSAWRLRSNGQRGLLPDVWGPLMGQWLMRTLDRSRRIYQAMKLRGFSGEYPQPPIMPLSRKDLAYMFFWISYFLINRGVNLPQLIGHLLTGGLS